MKRPQEKDYFEYRGKTLIMDHGSAENFMDAQDEYIDYLEAQIKSQESASLPCVSTGFSLTDNQIETIANLFSIRECLVTECLNTEWLLSHGFQFGMKVYRDLLNVS